MGIHCSPIIYLKKHRVDVTVYDHGVGQATKAAAGIISLGFPNGGIRPGIAWLVWEQIFTKNW